MKLNTLLLTSAATLMATSVAFAADLPSKKAAPSAGSVQVCRIGGMTGFTLPGSDTCLGISGFARFDAEYNLNSNENDADHDFDEWQGEARLTFDARSNTEIGVVRGVVQFGAEPDLSLRRAFVQFAGLTAGRKESIADVYGTQSIHFTNAGQDNEGVDYQVNVGGLNLGLGLEGPNDDGHEADTPDLVAHLSGSAGPVGFAVAAVSHQAVETVPAGSADGYALLGNVNMTMSGLRLGIFGGMAENAQNCTGAHTNLDDFVLTNDVESTIAGLSLLYSVGKVSLWAEVAQYNHQVDGLGIDATTDALAVGASYQLAKSLTLSAEYFHQDEELGGPLLTDAETETVQIRIQRDF